MATRSIRNLINTQIDKQLVNARGKLREEGKKQIHKLKQRLPSVDEIKKQLISEACSVNAQEKVQKNFDKFKKILGRIISKAEKGQKALNKIKEKLNKIQNIIIPRIQAIADHLTPIITILNTILNVIPIVLNAIPLQWITGGIIFKLKSIIDKAKLKVGEYSALIMCIPPMINIYFKQIIKLLSPLEKAMAAIMAFIEMVKKKLAFLEFLLLSYLQNCNVANQTPTDSGGNINPDLLEENILSGGTTSGTLVACTLPNGTIVQMTPQACLNAGGTYEDTVGEFPFANENLIGITDKMTTLYNDLLEGLASQGKTKVIERITNIDFGFRTSYKTITIPIS